MLKEVEVKARLQQPEETLMRLEAIGCKLGEPIEQRDRIFLKNGVEYSQVGTGTIFLRIRKQGEKTVFTFKQRMVNELDCLERELVVSSGDALADILPRLDFYEVLQVNKVRRKGSANGLVFCFDEVEGLGSFLEIEKMVEEGADSVTIQQELSAMLQELGVPESDRIAHGYDTLIYQKGRG